MGKQIIFTERSITLIVIWIAVVCISFADVVVGLVSAVLAYWLSRFVWSKKE